MGKNCDPKGPRHTQYFCTQYCDKKIKRHFFIQYFFPVGIENIYFWTIMLIETWFENILKCHYTIWKKKYLFIKMSFYRNIVWKNIVLTWA